MRIMTEEELDQIGGGQVKADVTNTLGTVTVTATRLRSYSGGYWIGGSGYYNPYDESSGSSGGCYYPPPPPPLDDPPTSDELDCIMNAVATPGNDLKTNWRFAVVNAYGYYNESTEHLMTSTYEWTTPPSGYDSVNGLTVHTPTDNYHGTSSVFAQGMDGTTGNAHVSYYNAAGTLTTYNLGRLSGIEEAVMTAAHEARHQAVSENPSLLLAGREAEADARTYAIQALERYRAGAGKNC